MSLCLTMFTFTMTRTRKKMTEFLRLGLFLWGMEVDDACLALLDERDSIFSLAIFPCVLYLVRLSD